MAKRKFIDLQVRVSSPIGMQLTSSVDKAVEIAKSHVSELLEMTDLDPRYWNAVVYETKYKNTWLIYAENKGGEINVLGPFVLGNSQQI